MFDKNETVQNESPQAEAHEADFSQSPYLTEVERSKYLTDPDFRSFADRTIGELEKARYEAYHDSATGLPNKRWLSEKLDSVIERSNGNFALMVIDLDGLKQVNDHEGHEAGNTMIKSASEAFEKSIRLSENPDKPRNKDEIDRVAVRTGGDEFVILLSDVSTVEDLEIVKSRILTNLEEVGIQASIGGKVHEPDEDAPTLIDNADKLMYAEKQRRKVAAKLEDYKLGHSRSSR